MVKIPGSEDVSVESAEEQDMDVTESQKIICELPIEHKQALIYGFYANADNIIRTGLEHAVLELMRVMDKHGVGKDDYSSDMASAMANAHTEMLSQYTTMLAIAFGLTPKQMLYMMPSLMKAVRINRREHLAKMGLSPNDAEEEKPEE